ncbi:MAG: hypothetical protein KDJ33_00335 [Gammaproteobacteria bacterium]|nr:hypothetical protein [Gammaproteobacteria bacterium]
MFLGLALLLGALLWARDIRRRADGEVPRYRGPLTMGGIGIGVFLFYLWLVTRGVSGS